MTVCNHAVTFYYHESQIFMIYLEIKVAYLHNLLTP